MKINNLKNLEDFLEKRPFGETFSKNKSYPVSFAGTKVVLTNKNTETVGTSEILKGLTIKKKSNQISFFLLRGKLKKITVSTQEEVISISRTSDKFEYVKITTKNGKTEKNIISFNNFKTILPNLLKKTGLV